MLKKAWSWLWDEENGPFWEWALAIGCFILAVGLVVAVIVFIGGPQ